MKRYTFLVEKEVTEKFDGYLEIEASSEHEAREIFNSMSHDEKNYGVEEWDPIPGSTRYASPIVIVELVNSEDV